MRSPMLEFEPGEWYLVVTCKKCKAHQPMLHDLTQGKSEIRGIYNWQCPLCQHLDYYDMEAIERYQHPEE
jgi:hypothetical protein